MIAGVFPLIGAALAGIQILDTHLRAASAPQQAAGMAMACAYAIVPYVFARSLEMLRGPQPTAVHPHPLEPAPDASGEPPAVVPSPSRRRAKTAWVIGALLLLLWLAMFARIIPVSSRDQELQRARELDAIDRMERKRSR